ncbi:Ribosomal RNA small subunit methyltransferase NEP1 [Frankliniella fusca]|uniref:18S rRNA (pseudouridine-N1)-methyltransferase n=1 Tax=Frankliniella fusca TaxID=407009 RepID=A0AAE1LIW7_9NEOP|nr:Ribosomal RNA small subunit methyltransferase NEP1 [Frankliniella fusca]
MGKMGKKRKANDDEYDANPPAKQNIAPHLKNQEKRLIVILEGAQLESVKIGNSFELLNSDDHLNMLRKNNRDPVRPDIAHQCLLMLLDSPLNRAGLLQVYIHTEKKVLIEVNPQTRIPRTFKRFASLMVQLLHKFSVRATDSSIKLLKVIKNPITDHLPVGCRKLATSYSASKISNPRELVPPEDPIAIVVGAMAHGKVSADYAEEWISISSYPLSGALACAKLCSGFEEKWGVA